MLQVHLVRAVALATGESPQTVRRRGFSLMGDPDDEPPLRDRLYLDCPGCGAVVRLTDHGYPGLPEFAECVRCDAAYPYSFDEVYDGGIAPGTAR